MHRNIGSRKRSSRPAPLAVTLLEDRVTPALIGALDPSFSSDGIASSTFNTGTNRYSAVALSGDGGYIAVGTDGVDQLVAKLDASGRLDTSFGGGDGFVTVNFAGAGRAEEALAVVVLPDRSIIVGGYFEFSATDDDATIFKLDSSGTLVPGSNKTVSASGSLDERVYGLAVFGNNVYAVGTDGGSVGGDVLTARYDTDLNVLTAASSTNLGGNDIGFAVAVASDGQVYVAGSGGAGSDFQVLRFNSTLGAFTSNNINFGGIDGATGIVIQPQTGRFYLGGITNASGTPGFAATEFDPATLLPIGTQFSQSFNGFDGASVMVAAPQGRVVLAGISGSTQAALVRLTPDLALDTTFNGTGLFTLEAGLDNTQRVGAVVDGLGRIVGVGGSSGTAAAIRVTGQIGQPAPLLITGPTNGSASSTAPTTSFNDYNPVSGPTPVIADFGTSLTPALADVNGDGVLDLIFGSGPGSDRVVVIDGNPANGGAKLADFSAFGGNTAGVFVAGADFDLDGKAEVVVSPGANNGGLGARVRVFRGSSLFGGTSSPALMADFAGLADANDGVADNSPSTLAVVGANVAVGDVNGDGVPDLVVGATGAGGPRATIWDGNNIAGANGVTPAAPPLANAFVFEAQQRGGVWVTLGDVTGDGLADLIGGGGPGGGPRVRIGDMAQILAAKNFGFFDDQLGVSRSNFFVRSDFDTYRAGIRVTARDIDGDTIADLVTSSGDGFPADVGYYLGTRLTTFTEGVQLPNGPINPNFGTDPLSLGVFVG